LDTTTAISTEEFESIEQHLLGQNSPEQQLAFENTLAADKTWAAKVAEVKLLLAGIETAAFKERIQGYHEQVKKNIPEKRGATIFSLNRKLLAAASVALVVALSVWLFTLRGNSAEKLYAAYYKPDPGLISAMGVGDNYVFNKAMLDYKTGNYNKAIAAWNGLKTEMRQNDTLLYFLGAAQQANGNNAAAIGLLQPLTTDTAQPFYKEACWYTGLALLKQGSTNQAIPYLKKSGRPEGPELISKIK
jgi:tetratricopeptide (TPR) repeat protein